MGKQRTPARSPNASGAGDENEDNQPFWDNTDSSLSRFIEELEVYLEAKNPEYRRLIQKGAVALSKTTAVKSNSHARFLASPRFVLCSWEQPFDLRWRDYATRPEIASEVAAAATELRDVIVTLEVMNGNEW